MGEQRSGRAQAAVIAGLVVILFMLVVVIAAAVNNYRGSSVTAQSAQQPTKDQLKRSARGVSYRAQQLANMAVLICEGFPATLPEQSPFVTNAFVESALVDARVLAWFLDRNKPKKKGYAHSKHFLPDWKHDVEDQTRGIIRVISYYLAHATLGAPEGEEHPGAWPVSELAVTLVGGLSDFVESLGDSPQRAWFTPDPVALYVQLRAADVLARPTVESDNPKTAGLTRSLQKYLRVKGLMT